MTYESIDSDQYAPGFRTVEHIIAAANWLQNELVHCLQTHDITLAQYNVLNVLNRADPDRRTCSEIGKELLDRTPDVTRLLDRLERNEFVERRRAKHDRRVVEVGITPKGKVVIGEVRKPISVLIDKLTESLSNVEHHLLTEYLIRLQSGTSAVR